MIPVPEKPLRITDTKPDSLTVSWEGLEAAKQKGIIGYILEYSEGSGGAQWKQWNDVIPIKTTAEAVHEEKVHVLISYVLYLSCYLRQ